MENRNIFPKHLNTDNLKKYSLNFILETNGWFENLLDLSENKSSSNKNFNRWCVRANRSNVINFQIESNILDKFGHLLLCDDSTSPDIEPKLIPKPIFLLL